MLVSSASLDRSAKRIYNSEKGASGAAAKWLPRLQRNEKEQVFWKSWRSADMQWRRRSQLLQKLQALQKGKMRRITLSTQQRHSATSGWMQKL